MKIKLLLSLGIVFIILFIFRSWFTLNSLSMGDWEYKFTQAISEYSIYPYSWNPNFGAGLGSSSVFLLALDTYFKASVSILFNYLYLPWPIIEKLVWFFPFIIISVLGSFFLFKKQLIKDNLFALISSLIFSTNSYILMVVGGGQMGIGMAYAMLPLVFLGFLAILENLEKKNISISIIAGICFSIQLLFDLRIAYVSMVFLGIYYLLFSYLNGFIKTIRSSFLRFVIAPGLVIVGLHFFWIFPFIVLGENPLEKLGSAYSGSGIVSFLSFATFENTISLLHPNWPENLFGKIYFMRSEFLVLPIIAFIPFLFVKRDKNFKKILIFSVSALLGAFLAKGSNEPFGNLYVWAFEKVPGFMMFRDSTKWYGVVALSYSILISYFFYILSKFEIKKIKIINVLLILFIIFWIFTLRENFTGSLKGTFISKQVPTEYSQLTDFLSSQKQYFRTLWVPIYHQYSYYSNSHPIIAGTNFYSAYVPNDLIKKIGNDVDFLRKSAVKYVIVPSDTEGKIFLEDRKYDNSKYIETVEGLSKIQALKKTKDFGKISVFEIPDPKDHFWTNSKNLSLSYKVISSVEYELNIKNANKNDVVIFSEKFDSRWFAREVNTRLNEREKLIPSDPYSRVFNSFILRRPGDYMLKVYYYPQKLVTIGMAVSFIVLIASIAIVLFGYRFKT